MGAKNRIGIGLSYRPARLHYIGWRNRFLFPFLLGIRNEAFTNSFSVEIRRDWLLVEYRLGGKSKHSLRASLENLCTSSLANTPQVLAQNLHIF
jgi:hypothetical protein